MAPALLLAWPAAAFAADGAKPPAFHPDTTPLDPSVAGGSGGSGSPVAVGSATGDIVRTIVGLAVVLAVVDGVDYLLKSAAKARTAQGDSRIEVVATTTVAPNRSLHLVRSGDELILIGAAENAITPLRVYSAEEAGRMELQARTAAQPGAPAPPAAGRRGLLETLRQMTVRG